MIYSLDIFKIQYSPSETRYFTNQTGYLCTTINSKFLLHLHKFYIFKFEVQLQHWSSDSNLNTHTHTYILDICHPKNSIMHENMDIKKQKTKKTRTRTHKPTNKNKHNEKQTSTPDIFPYQQQTKIYHVCFYCSSSL